MAEKMRWAQQNMAALVKGFVRNTLIYRALLVIFLMAAFLIPWLWLVSGFTLRVLEILTGKARRCESSREDSR
jgi:hypothetical protein